MTFLSVLIALLGLCIGSFLNVVIYRLPRRMSVVHPRSHCTACEHPLAWHQLIPLVSFLIQRGRCVACSTRISRTYPAIELLTGLAFVSLFHVLGPTLPFVRLAILAALLLAAAEIDRRHRIIPNRLILAGLGLGLGLLLAEPIALGPHLLASCTVALLLWGLRRLSLYAVGRPGLGMGDVKLAAMAGLFLGWDVLWVVYLAAVLGGLLGLGGLLLRRMTRTTALPFAPFVALATALYIAVPWTPWALLP